MTIKLQFLQGTDASSRMIQWFSHGPWSHVDAVLDDGTLLGARADGGVAIRPSSYTGADKTCRADIPCTPEQEAAFYRFLALQIGKPYDMTGIIGFVADRNWRQDDSWFCRELVTAAEEQCGLFPYPLVSPANKITPTDAYLLSSVFGPVASVW